MTANVTDKLWEIADVVDSGFKKRVGASMQKLFLATILSGSVMIQSSPGVAAGALAVGLPPDVVKGGFTYGYTNDKATTDEAQSTALEQCRTSRDAKANSKLRSYCKITFTYSNQCVAVAMDPAAGTPGVGWAVANDLRSAESQALAKCEETAGPARRAACKIDHSFCDGTAK